MNEHDPDITPTEPHTPDFSSVSVLALRRTLRECHAAAKSTHNDLAALKNGSSLPAGSSAYAAIAGVALGERYPVQDPDRDLFSRAIEMAERGQLTGYLDDAVDEVGSVVRLMEKGLRGLEVLDHLTRPLPAGWSNLSAPAMARAISDHCLAVIGPTLLR
ncbi:hypothetical protein ABLO27_12760 [Roseibium sp. SCPC15]|uniref:hypothetical protein n=1 Tax=Roseibium sp. SCP15 TaxID=3141376 RepID=UPI00333D1BCE